MNEFTDQSTGSRILCVLKWLLWGVRWLAIVVFGLLLVAGVLFKLPWKILVCLAVIPAVGIFVPRRIQPWCWGALAALLIGVGGWILWPRADGGRWRTYRYDEALSDVLVLRRLDGVPNAAALYNQVLREHDERIFEPGRYGIQVEWQTFEDPWSAEEFPEVAERLEPLGPAIETLLEAVKIDQCRFPIGHDMRALRLQLRRINQLKGWGHWLIRSANGDLQAGRLSAALDKQLAVLGMARHLYQQQTLFDQAGGFFLEVAAARVLRRYVLDYAETEEELDRIVAALERVEPNWPAAWDGIVETEKLMAKNLAALVYQVDDRGRTRIHRDAITSVVEGLGYSVPAILQQRLISRATALGLWLSIPVTPGNAGRLIDRRFDKFSELARQGTPGRVVPMQYAWRLGLNPASAVDWLARQQMSYYAALDGQYKRHIALGRATVIMIELRRYYLEHNRWPDDLSALETRLSEDTYIDQFSGVPFAYGLTEEGFYFYSLGQNAIDDGGRNNAREKLDDIVFWPVDFPEPDTEYDDAW